MLLVVLLLLTSASLLSATEPGLIEIISDVIEEDNNDEGDDDPSIYDNIIPFQAGGRDTSLDGKPVHLDTFAIRKIYPSVEPRRDWTSNWDEERHLSHAKEVDPVDSRSLPHGRGRMRFGGGELVMEGPLPRLYISATDDEGWRNTEFTVYARVEGWNRRRSAFTLISRSNHDLVHQNPCEAHGYYARIHFNTGLVLVKKEFRHSREDGVVYSSNIFSKDNSTMTSMSDFDYVSQFIGIKSVVRDNPDGRSVHLEVWIDVTGGTDGGDWQRVLEYDDFNLAARSPPYCSFAYTPDGVSHDEAPVLRPGRVMALRSDSVDGAHWRSASIREIPPVS